MFCGIFSRDEAEMEYLKMVQDLDMHGVNYFQIRVSIKGAYAFHVPYYIQMYLLKV